MHRQTDTQTNRIHKHSSSLLKSVKTHGIQMKIHFQPFWSKAHIISEIFWMTLYMKHIFLYLYKMRSFCCICFNKSMQKCVLNFSANGCNVSENFGASLYTKYFYYLSHFLWETCFCISKWHTLISLYLVQYKYVIISFKHFPHRIVKFCMSLYTKYL